MYVYVHVQLFVRVT